MDGWPCLVDIQTPAQRITGTHGPWRVWPGLMTEGACGWGGGLQSPRWGQGRGKQDPTLDTHRPGFQVAVVSLGRPLRSCSSLAVAQPRAQSPRLRRPEG